MIRTPVSFLFFLALSQTLFSQNSGESLPAYTSPEQIPQNALALWSDYDPRTEALAVETHDEWKKDGVVSRLVTFRVGTFKGAESRIAAYYCFPEREGRHPAFVWSHGGGQRADRNRGHYFATQGFATIDINWLGRPLENETQDLTDWGKVDPTQGPNFYKKALREHFKSDFQPDEYSIDPIESPRNSNWFLLSLAGRRALTFLEKQPEVDPEKLGFTGFSMGGTITSMTAIDTRLKAVAPFVGGTANLFRNYPGMNHGSVIRNIKDIELYKRTIDPGAYWPEVSVPVLFLSSSNDFHSTFERIYESMEMLPHRMWRVTSNIHANHGPGPEQWVVLNHWFRHYLAGEKKAIPATPDSQFSIAGETAELVVKPDQIERLSEVEIYYSYDPNSVTRFWNRANRVKKSDTTWTATIPIQSGLPLFTHALCRYRLQEEEPLERGATNTFVINSENQVHLPEKIDLTRLKNVEKTPLIDDFRNGMQNWSSRDQRTFKTYKFQDPALETDGNRMLQITLVLDPEKPLLLGLGTDSKFLGNGRDQGTFHHGRRITGKGETNVLIKPEEFTNKDRKTLDWSAITTFSITLTDAATRKPIDLSRTENRDLLRRIELVAP